MEGTPVVHEYEYDHLGRLAKVWVDNVEQATYTYDDNGNRLNDGAQYDDQDRLTSNDQYDFTYTANGELATKTDKATLEVTSYVYDAFGNLVSVDFPNTTDDITYKADGRGRRVAKNVGGTLAQQFIYGSQLQVVAEIADGVFTRFVYSGKRNVPDYAVRDGVLYRVITDHLGSLRMVVRASDGAVMQSRSYDAWGNMLPGEFVANEFRALPFGFAGGLSDADTGLVRFGARDYDPSVGRWVAKDPIRFAGGDPSLYGYVLDDPVNRRDPKGTVSFECWQKCMSGQGGTMALSAFAAVVLSYVSPLYGAAAFGGGTGAFNGACWAVCDDLESPAPEPEEIQVICPSEVKPDAYRHCLASCVAVGQFGDTVAGWAGDYWDRRDPSPSGCMDRRNNELGRGLGEGIDDAVNDCRQRGMSALLSGSLQTHPE